MAEYWKSTPKYWCKFCEIHVRDTKFDRQQHESTGKHQGAIQRNLRKLHKDQEQKEREAQRAKDEVARLKTLVSGAPTLGSGETTRAGPSKTAYHAPAPAKATEADRKAQMAQLAAMGIQIPEQYRNEMALAGEWTTVSEKVIEPKKEVKQEDNDSKAGVFGDRKRKHMNDDHEEEPIYRKKTLGQKTFPGSRDDGDDLDALISGIVPKKAVESVTVKTEDNATDVVPVKKEESEEQDTKSFIKEEDGKPEDTIKTADVAPEAAVPAGSGIVFKKRKKPSKPI